MPVTDDPNDPRIGRGVDSAAGPQNAVYLVLSESERAKGFIRPLRHAYEHVGAPGPVAEVRDLTPEEHERYDQYGYVKFEPYPETGSSAIGRFWTQPQLDNIGKGCRSVTTMQGAELAETYARNPTFYGSTYCVSCRKHLPVEEFVWSRDGQRVGS